MRKFLTLFFTVLLSGAALHGPTIDARAEGRDRCQVWSGQYFYQKNRRENVPVLFQMTVVISRGRILGFVTEPNTFGDKTSETLHGSISGTIDGDAVAWTKTYDGTAGVSHSVHNEGRLDSKRRRIEGRWTISDRASGTFYVDIE